MLDNQLILSQLDATTIYCAGFAGEFELRLQLDYRHPLDIARDGSDTNIVDAACSILSNRHNSGFDLRIFGIIAACLKSASRAQVRENP